MIILCEKMIVIPRYIVIEENGIDKLDDILLKLYLKNPLVITGKKPKNMLQILTVSIIQILI